jgi:probable rRNA maturation factor
MLFIENNNNCAINIGLLEEILKKLSDKDVELLIINDIDMKKLNFEQRNINKTTDVLSFPLMQSPHTPLGSIVINELKVAQIAQKLGHSESEEIALLFIHGLLHLLGYDHETDNGKMREKEENLIAIFNLPKSLIVRAK